MNLNLQAELARLASIFGSEAVREQAEKVTLLPDFSRAMEAELRKLVASYRHPVWTNAKTGNPASSVHAAFDAIGFTTSKAQRAMSKRSHLSLKAA